MTYGLVLKQPLPSECLPFISVGVKRPEQYSYHLPVDWPLLCTRARGRIITYFCEALTKRFNIHWPICSHGPISRCEANTAGWLAWPSSSCSHWDVGISLLAGLWGKLGLSGPKEADLLSPPLPLSLCLEQVMVPLRDSRHIGSTRGEACTKGPEGPREPPGLLVLTRLTARPTLTASPWKTC